MSIPMRPPLPAWCVSSGVLAAGQQRGCCHDSMRHPARCCADCVALDRCCSGNFRSESRWRRSGCTTWAGMHAAGLPLSVLQERPGACSMLACAHLHPSRDTKIGRQEAPTQADMLSWPSEACLGIVYSSAFEIVTTFTSARARSANTCCTTFVDFGRNRWAPCSLEVLWS